MPDDLQIFDASYNSRTGEVTYGGFVFHGERYTWDTVAPGMVSIDASTGKRFSQAEIIVIRMQMGIILTFPVRPGTKCQPFPEP